MSGTDTIRKVRAHLPDDSDITATRIVKAASDNHVNVSDACALLEQESNFRNIFGHDQRGMFPGEQVTREKVKALIKHVQAGGTSNGVGVTQLTSLGFILQAEQAGGAHLPAIQADVGLHLLGQLQQSYGRRDGFAAYNAGPGGRHSQVGQAYASHCLWLADKWHNWLK